MKTTIEIADDLFERTQRLARAQETTFRALTEEGLRLVLEREKQPRKKKLRPLATFGGSGLTDEFRQWDWLRVRDAVYEGRGA